MFNGSSIFLKITWVSPFKKKNCSTFGDIRKKVIYCTFYEERLFKNNIQEEVYQIDEILFEHQTVSSKCFLIGIFVSNMKILFYSNWDMTHFSRTQFLLKFWMNFWLKLIFQDNCNVIIVLYLKCWKLYFMKPVCE